MLSQFFALFLLSISSVSADLLKNPGFESTPTGVPKNTSATPFVELSSENNTIPGWDFEGTVSYVTLSSDHALQLGSDGKINQTFISSGDLTDYLLTFTIVPGRANCAANADLLVAAPDSSGVYKFDNEYGNDTWQSYGHYLGAWEDGDSVNLVIGSQSSEDNSSTICWPIIDNLILKNMTKTDQNDGNLLSNGDFELGPDFLGNSSEGIFVGPASSPIQSALPYWSVLGTVRYIDSAHFLVPQGNAAVELVSGVSSGIQTAVQLMVGLSYNLEFKLGDANNSCVENFVVGAQFGTKVQNFTVESSGTGSTSNFTMTFKVDSSTVTIGFVSYTTGRTKDGILCGPVVDDVVLTASNGDKKGVVSSGTKRASQLLILVSLLLGALLW